MDRRYKIAELHQSIRASDVRHITDGVPESFTDIPLHIAGQLVRMVPTTPNFGGRRWWFKCRYCGNRAGVLYMPRVACRKCSGFVNQSAQISKADRPAIEMYKIHAKLGITGENFGTLPILNDWHKPKGMHWKRFRRYQRRYDYLMNQHIGYVLRISSHLSPRLKELAERY